VNSTIACALVCVKLGVKVAHVEAGLRSRDRTMPEEINRLLTDQIADLLFTPSHDADENLIAEGIPRERIRFVGNVMIDSLQRNLEVARALPTREQLGLKGIDYALLTLHRPSNVDLRDSFERILAALEVIAAKLPIVFPVHPRTRKTIAELGLSDRVESIKDLRLVEPLGYLDFLNLSSSARLVLTDSGGIQEETTALGIPCLTLRENTERPITVEMGTNVIVGTDTTKIIAAASATLNGSAKKTLKQPPLWDGHTSERILDALADYSR
jgi:UDP-N-acetylglucosamine 2-epimerase (non-hydrolysing)